METTSEKSSVRRTDLRFIPSLFVVPIAVIFSIKSSQLNTKLSIDIGKKY